jgi:cobalt-zinc-cadmium efflux system outer membrane protein
MNRNLIILLLILLSSCAQEIPDQKEIADQTSSIDIYSAKPDQTEPVSELLKKESLSSEDALYIAWHYHPDMKRSRFMIGSAYGSKTQAGLWPNPSMSIHYKDEEALIFLERSETAETWFDIKSRVKETFVKLAYAQKLITIQESLVSIDNERSELLKSLFNGGKLPEEKYLKAEEQSQLSQALLKEYKSLIDDAENQICIAVGLPLDKKPAEYRCSLEVVSPLADDFTTLLDLVKTNNPALKKARMRTAVSKARYNLERTERWPDLTVKAGIMRVMPEVGDDFNEIQAGISFQIPFWNRSQGNISSARDQINASKEAETAAALKAGSILSQVFNSRKRLLAEDTVYKEKILPSAEKRVKLAQDAFKNGKTSRLELLKVMRELTIMRAKHYRIKFMVSAATIQLERTIPPQRIVKK